MDRVDLRKDVNDAGGDEVAGGGEGDDGGEVFVAEAEAVAGCGRVGGARTGTATGAAAALDAVGFDAEVG